MLRVFASLVFLIGLAQAQGFQASIQSIPKSIQQKMHGVTWQPACPTPLSQLAYVKLSYWGFDHKAHKGSLIINKSLAPEIVAIFKELYKKHFPIQQMQPMYVFHGNDLASMAANNTSAFNCRMLTGSKTKFSRHAYGRAIDINPLLNPYVRGKQVLPLNAKKYLKRQQNFPGMITAESPIYHIFKKYGWRWGGNWKSLKDYQHFERK